MKRESKLGHAAAAYLAMATIKRTAQDWLDLAARHRARAAIGESRGDMRMMADYLAAALRCEAKANALSGAKL